MTAVIVILLAVVAVQQVRWMLYRRYAQSALKSDQDFINYLRACNNRWHTVSLELAVQLDLERRRGLGLLPRRLQRPRGGRS